MLLQNLPIFIHNCILSQLDGNELPPFIIDGDDFEGDDAVDNISRYLVFGEK